jgi:3-hydroxyisobutyrate dehydrogenase
MTTPRTDPKSPTAPIGFVGLGNMGGRIARRLADAGFEVHGYDVDPSRAEAVGAHRADSVSAVARAASVVLLSLPDSTVVESVVYGDGGLAEALSDGQVLVDLSTAAPSSSVRVAETLEARGTSFVDAGISGGAAAAEVGRLTLMVGGEAETIERLQPVFAAFSSSVVHMGAVGSGHLTKLLNNFLNAVTLAATAEVMVAARKAGLDLHRVLDVFNSSSGRSFATSERFPKIVDGDYLEGGLTGRLMMKDVTLYVDLVRELGAPSLNAAGPLASFGLAIALGYGDVISNRVVDAIGDLAGGVRLHED